MADQRVVKTLREKLKEHHFLQRVELKQLAIQKEQMKLKEPQLETEKEQQKLKEWQWVLQMAAMTR